MASVAVDREIRRRLTSGGSGLDHPHAHHHHRHHHHHAAAAVAAVALPAHKIVLSPGKGPIPQHGHKRRNNEDVLTPVAPPPAPPAPPAPDAHLPSAKRRKHGSGVGVREDMFQHYQPWVIHTYGDSAKTKTITLRKYARIVRTLRGEETNSVENSKFRFWVKAKGFRLGQPQGYVAKPADGIIGSQTLSGAKDARDDPPLYVPISAAKDGFGGNSGGGNQFKKVAVVENFFDIIYSVHVEMEGRAGKHAGQKRTYRTITETYAFLPREAVTRFLLGCTDCQRRPRSRSASPSPCTSPAPLPTPIPNNTSPPPHTTPSQPSPLAPPPPPLLQPHLPMHPYGQLHHLHALATRPLHTPVPPPPLNLPPTPPPAPPPTVDLVVATAAASPAVALPSPAESARSPAPLSPAPPSPAVRPLEETRPQGASPARSPAPPRTPPRLSPSPAATPGRASPHPPAGGAPGAVAPPPTMRLFSSNGPLRGAEPVSIDFSLPITTTYLKHMRALGLADADALRLDAEDNVSTPEAEGSEDDHYSGATKEADKLRQMLLAWNGHAGRNGDMRLPEEREGADDAAGLWAGYHGVLGLKKSTPPGSGREQSSPLMLSDRGLAQETASLHDETSSSGNKEDEDDDDDDAEDKIDPHQYDPERLKAFNMFVRLFVDENLDRIVPISKQPKEKIQAIIDSCARQFPEFAERARKRIRTYLKSCRRNKRSRDSNGAWDATRPTPAHLTSVQAEQILAQACENESHNAKRMRLGLEPVSQPMPLMPPNAVDGRPSPLEHYTTAASDSKLNLTSAALKSEPISHATEAAGALSPASFGVAAAGAVAATASTKGTTASAAVAAGGGTASASVPGGGASVNGTASSAAPTSVYRPNFSQAFQRAAAAATAATASPYAAPAVFGGAPFGTSGGMLSNGPTDLSMKTKPLLSHKLNTAEMAAVRQLITGYRESAAFLLRSADELEQLLLQQQ